MTSALADRARSARDRPFAVPPLSDFLVAAALLLGSLALSAWFLPYRLPTSDEGAVLAQAARILEGQVYYRDIDAYALPGASYLVAGVMAVFGQHLDVSRWLAAAVYAAIVLGIWANARNLLSPRRAALAGCAMFAFKFAAWPGLTSYVYADVAFAFACISVAVFVKHEEARSGAGLFLAGALAGLALACKQNVGIYLAGASVGWLLLAPFLLRTDPANREPIARRASAYLLGLAAALAPGLIHFAHQGVLGQLVESAFVRPFTVYAPTSGISFFAPLRWWELGGMDAMESLAYMPEPYWQMLRTGRLPGEALQPFYGVLGEVAGRAIYTGVVVVLVGLVVAAVRARLGKPSRRERRIVLFGTLSSAVFLSIFPRADYPHLISVFPLILVLGMALAGTLGRQRASERGRARLRRAEAWGVAALVLLSVGLAARQHHFLTYEMRLERAHVRISPEVSYVESIVRYVRDEVEPGETVLVVVHEAYYYFLTDRHSRWPFVQLYPGMEGADGGEALIEMLSREPPRLVISGLWNVPGLPTLADYAPALVRWLNAHYERDDEAFARYPPAHPIMWNQVLLPHAAPE